MKCPIEIEPILVDIVTYGLLQSRAAGWSGDAARAAIEADHVHNLPRLLSDFDPVGLAYYWDTERPAYLARAEEDSAALFEPLWKQLRPHVEPLLAAASH